MVSWLEKAMDAYWRDRLYGILNQVGKVPSSTIITHWTEALDDMYGKEEERKKALINNALKDENVSQKAKDWLKTL